MKKLTAKHRPKFNEDLRQLVRTGAETFGDKTLYIYKRNKEEKTFTYRENYERMNKLGSAFAKLGLMGKRVAVMGDTCPEYMTTFFAAVNGAGVCVPLDKDLKDDVLIDFMNIAKVEAVVYTDSFNNRVRTWADRLPLVRYFVPIMPETEDCSADNVIPFEDMIKIGEKELEAGNTEYLNCELDVNQMAALLFTSGTTGTAKGVMLSHKNINAATSSADMSMEYDENNVFVDALPMHHSYELVVGHLAIQNLGATMVINDSLKNVMRNFQTYKPNAEMLVPLFVETMYKKIWSEIDKKGMRKKVRAAMAISNALLKVGIDMRDKFFKPITSALGGKLESIVVGGAPISPQIIKDFYSFGIFVLEGYGITECSPLVAVNRPNKVRYHSVGQPVYCCQVRIEKEHPDDETGEICVKGDNVMMGYYENEEATKAVFTEDGWFRTGDIGYMDKDDYIYITGRKKNVIILSNGKNIFPEELEEHLSHCSLVGESVVVGRKHENGEIVITAVIYPEPEMVKDMDADKIYESVKAQVTAMNKDLPVYKQIREIEIRNEEFEKNTSHKIIRYKVK